MLEIRRALIARGAEVCVATHGGVHEKILKAENVPYTVVGEGFTDERSREFVRMGAGMGPTDQSMWSDAEIESYATAEARFFEENDVAVAVTGFTLTALLSSRLAKIPLVTEHAGSFVPPVWERKMIEPFLDLTIPGANHLPRFLRRVLSNLGANHVKFHCAGFNRVAEKLDLERVPSFSALLLADLTLVTDTPDVLGVDASAMEQWRPRGKGYRPSTRLRYAGPIFAQLDLPLPERAARFLEGDHPIIYVAITSSTTDEVRGVVRSLAAMGARLLVASTVHEVAELESDNVLVEGVLPSHLVMPKVDLAITAGGQGSVQCAMAAGCPLIAIPLQPEQDFNGQLVERHHAGARLAMKDAMTPRIAELAKKILADRSYRDGARRIQESYAKVDGPGVAADAILERFVA